MSGGAYADSTSPPSETTVENGPLAVGTLRYTRAGLVMTFVWLSVGSLGFGLMVSSIPTMLPLTLKTLDASNLLIGIFVGSMPAAMNMIVNPVVSFRSDRTRTVWGRRRPYIMAATPAITVLLLLIGWGPKLIAGMGWPPAAVSAVSIAFLGVLVVFYQLFYLFVGSTIYYLFVDVVPRHYIGRYMALFNMIGAVKGFVFGQYLFKFARNYSAELYTGIALFYLATMALMLWKVKEGKYPPVDEAEKRCSFLDGVRTYFRECFSIPFYIWLFLAMGINYASNVCRNLFIVFFAEQNIGLNYEQIGTVNGYAALLAVLCAMPLGFLNDRIHPLKVFTLGGVMVMVFNALAFFLIRSYDGYFIWTLLLSLAYTVQYSAALPMSAALFPGSRYGQFGSAQAMFVSVILIVANSLGGWFMDKVKDYRYLYAWDFFFTVIALAALLMVFRLWKRYGGEKNYIAPLGGVAGITPRTLRPER
ncbi:MAG: MFS transporter [Lentisphaeria bacterium]|nr:MFS transporter [Lentisphaeria bacterium]